MTRKKPGILLYWSTVISLVIASIAVSFLISSIYEGFLFDMEVLKHGRTLIILGYSLSFIIGFLSTIAFSSVIPAIFLGFPLVLVELRHGYMGFSFITSFIGGIITGIFLLRKKIEFSKDVQIDFVEVNLDTRKLLPSIALGLIGYGFIGMFLEQYFLKLYINWKIWLIVVLFSAFINSLYTKSKPISSIFSFLGPPSILISFLPASYSLVAESEDREELLFIGDVIAVLGKNGEKKTWKIPLQAKKAVFGNWRWIKKERQAFVIEPKKSRNPHMIIIGESGSGKSTLAKIIAIESIKKGFDVVILDFHGEYRDLQETGFKIISSEESGPNILDLYGSSPTERALELSFSLANIFSLGPIQRALLLDLLMEAYKIKGIYDEDPDTWNKTAPTMKDVILLIRERIKHSVKKDEMIRLDSLLKYLSIIENIGSNSKIQFEDFEGGVIIDLSKLPSETIQELYSDIFARKIYEYKQRKREPDKLMLMIVDEAHRVLGKTVYEKKKNVFTRLLAESRKHGLGIVMISQNPNDFDQQIISNCSTKISFRISETRSAEYTAKLLSPVFERPLIELVVTTLKNLPVQYAIASTEKTNNLIVFKTKQYKSRHG